MTDSMSLSTEDNKILSSLPDNKELIMGVGIDTDEVERLNTLGKSDSNCISIKNDIFSPFISVNILDKLILTDISLDNYEDILGLYNLKKIELNNANQENIRTLKYDDNNDSSVALIKFDMLTKKFSLSAYSNIFPKQIFIPPAKVYSKILTKAQMKNWNLENGGKNQFDGSEEVRYKDEFGKVMAAVITKPSGSIDTIVEYIYKDDAKVQMVHTNSFGCTYTIYSTQDASVRMKINIDSAGYISYIIGDYND